MKSVLIREQKRYSIVELTERFKCTEPQIKPILRKLKEYGVLKTVKADKDKKDLTDLVEADIEVQMGIMESVSMTDQELLTQMNELIKLEFGKTVLCIRGIVH